VIDLIHRDASHVVHAYSIAPFGLEAARIGCPEAVWSQYLQVAKLVDWKSTSSAFCSGQIHQCHSVVVVDMRVSATH
jgi:hypothetical protein